MSLIRSCLVILALLGAFSVHADPVRVDSGSALARVVKHFGWLESAGVNVAWTQPGQPADFFAANGEQALAARAAGKPLKAIYVLSRSPAGDDAHFLLASETLLAQRGPEARVILTALERARNWIVADPAAAEALAGAAVHDRNFSGSRPGPAQLVSLKKLARANGLDEQLGTAVLDDSAYRAALTRARSDSLAILSR